MSKVIACIVARTNSTRLPKKVLKKINGITMIEYIIKKIQRCKSISDIYICTSYDDDDHILLEIADKNGIKSYAGSKDSVIDRLIDVGKIENADAIVRITGDNVFTDEVYLDLMISNHIRHNADYTRTEYLPIGVTSEVISMSALEKCYSIMNPDESQYLLLYIFNPVIFKCLVLVPPISHQKPNLTLTVDSPNDWQRTNVIIGDSNTPLNYADILKVIENNETIPNIEYDPLGDVKFPANLTFSFSAFRLEIENRIKRSISIEINETDYHEVFSKQRV